MKPVHKGWPPDGGFLGVPEPRVYRKRPHEAYTAQAYFFLFWWYRGYLWATIGSVVVLALALAGFILTLWHPLAMVSAWSMVALMALAFLRVVFRDMKPDQLATSFEYDYETPE
jgi:hypothetical protein